MTILSIRASLFIGLVFCAGCLGMIGASAEPVLRDLPRFLCYLVLALIFSGLKVSIPGVTGTMSVNFLFILMGVAELNLPQTLILGMGAAMVQIFWHARKTPKLVQVLFNQGCIALAICMAFVAYRSPVVHAFGTNVPLLLIAAAAAYFLCNTFPVACIISLTEQKRLYKTWKECYLWSFPYYMVGAALVCVITVINKNVGWQFSLLALPVCYVIYRSYRMYVERIQTETYVEQMNSLHLRTIEALALAIEARDHTTHEHLERVQHYAISMGELLGLSDLELDALRAASVLHDIGKLAVPEHIISKPGKLTPQEFEKMKIHPVVGAEILERVDFPYPVAPIVRAHHEKWDGSGYPAGLKGEEIPIGARILSAVDCLDALASDRQYRRALNLEDAMAVVAGEAGKAYDPRVVQLLQQHYLRLEAEAKGVAHKKAKQLSINLRIERGAAPGAGFEAPRKENYVEQIAAAGQEVQFMLGLVRELGTSLNLQETLSTTARRLSAVLSFQALAVYECRDEVLLPVYVEGHESELFSSLQIPMGEGISGWVAKHNKAIINGNPSVEPGYLNDPSLFSTLRSALAVPLEGMNGVVGVLTLYHAAQDAFGHDELRILTGISAKIGHSIENILKYRQLENFATTDHLTGLLNARSLFERLEKDLARCQRDKTSLTVLLCDMDGFKQVNDRFGHASGNRVLQLFAQGLLKGNREYDVVARIGGDEFVVLVCGLDQPALEEKIAAMTQAAAEAGLEVCGEGVVSLSVGYSIYDGVALPARTPDPNALVAEADQRMYEMKARRKRPIPIPLSEPDMPEFVH
jgi:diguanylate cyclase (GGDEF)-like protein/putative nucleotidyltransferase with HDIG domain